MSVRSLLPLLMAIVLGGCSSGSSRGTGALSAQRTVPLTTVTFSGHRYVTRADLGIGRPVPLMVHGNSRMFLTLTHAAGEVLNGGPIRKTEDYGYSAKGKGILHVARMRLGGKPFSEIPPVPVFDFSETGDTAVQGMIGVPFLVAARAAVDFSRDRLLLGVASRSDPDPELVAHGYAWTPFEIGVGHRAILQARFPVLNRTLPITPSTVSTALTLHLPLFAGKVPMSKTPSPDRSPHRTTPDEFACERVDFEIAGARMHSPATFEDFAEYGNVAERELDTFGMLGFDWMKEHEAILDYANRRLYFRPSGATAPKPR